MRIDRRALFATAMAPTPTPAPMEVDEGFARQCESRLEELRAMEPLSSLDLRSLLAQHRFGRRAFLGWSAGITAALMLPPIFTSKVAEAAELTNRIPVLWLEGQDCAGCTVAFLRATTPTVSELILQRWALQYHETLMVPAGFQAEQSLAAAAKQYAGKYVLVVEGSIPGGANGGYCTIGASGQTFLDKVKSLASSAVAVVAVGNCAAYGGIPAAHPNPTGAMQTSDVVSGVPVINIPACPMNPDNLLGTMVHYTLTGSWPALDSELRPTWAFGTLIHDNCPRRGHFDAGEYVEQWGDEEAQANFCLYKMGCAGPQTYNNCPSIGYNENTSWPIRAGHGCIGCSQPAFWDQLARERSLVSAAQHPPGLFGLGVQSSADEIGLGLLAAAGAGIAIHAIATGASKLQARRHATDGDAHLPPPPAESRGPGTETGAQGGAQTEGTE